MLKFNLNNCNFSQTPITQNRPYLLNEKINTNIKESVNQKKIIETDDNKTKWASTILSEPSLYNKIAVKWAKKIIEVKNEQNN